MIMRISDDSAGLSFRIARHSELLSFQFLPPSGPRITLMREIELGGTDALLAKLAVPARAPRCSNLRRVEEVANERHGFCWALFHQPMPGARNDRLLNVARDVPHDDRLKRTK
jgi:hypothetical protein